MNSAAASRVPGEGVEPSRAEAHGFLRPARLPIPPSRPGRTSVAGRASAKVAVALAGALLVGCVGRTPAGDGSTPSAPPTIHTIAFLFDGSPQDADLVSGPALAGLELAAQRSSGIEIEPVNVGDDPDAAVEELGAIGDDPGVVAAVVAPLTAPPQGALAALGAAEVPVVSLSWAWGPPGGGSGLWRSLAADEETEGALLLDAGTGGLACIAGDGEATSRSLADTVSGLAAGDPAILDAGTVDPGRPATASAVAGRLSRCRVVLWTGGVDSAALLFSEVPDPLAVVGTSRLKNDTTLEMVAGAQARADTVCGCVDVTLSQEAPLQRFVHDFQAASAGPPGPFAVEAYDAGRMLVGLLREGVATRAGLAGRLTALRSFRGLVREYRFGADGALTPGSVTSGRWRASGSRWLPVGPA
jgi:hypothetical protein